MAKDEIAILISITSVLIASLSLGWNIYRDLILRAKVRVSAAIVFILHDTLPHRPQYISIEITNFGPGTVHMSAICAKQAQLWRRLLRRTKHAVINHDWTNPLSAKLPHKLEVADKMNLLLPYDKDCLLKEPFTHLGAADYYGRVHWAPLYQLRKARRDWLRDFGNEVQQGAPADGSRPAGEPRR